MGRPAVKLTETGAIADFIRDASVRLGIPQERLKTAVRASQELSREELEVMTSLAEYARGGTSMNRRSALSRGIKSAIETFPKAEEEEDPLADVDDPMSPEEAAAAVALAEAKSQINRQHILKGALSVAEAAS